MWHQRQIYMKVSSFQKVQPKIRIFNYKHTYIMPYYHHQCDIIVNIRMYSNIHNLLRLNMRYGGLDTRQFVTFTHSPEVVFNLYPSLQKHPEPKGSVQTVRLSSVRQMSLVEHFLYTKSVLPLCIFPLQNTVLHRAVFPSSTNCRKSLTKEKEEREQVDLK